MATTKSVVFPMLSKPNRNKKKKYQNPCQMLEEADSEIRQNAEAVVLIVRSEDLVEQGDGTFTLVTKPLYERVIDPQAKLSKDFFFRSAPSCFSLGTGFFLQKNVIATAAHVLFPLFEQLRLADLSFIRGVFKDEDFKQIKKEQIYTAQYDALQAGHFKISQSAADWALVPIKAKEDHQLFELPKPNPFGFSHKTQVYALGHGFGLSMKLNATPAKVLYNNTSSPCFECNLPAFVSSSGAPIFNAETHELIGMLVRGTNQLQIEENLISLRSPTSTKEGEECQRLDPMLASLQWA